MLRDKPDPSSNPVPPAQIDPVIIRSVGGGDRRSGGTYANRVAEQLAQSTISQVEAAGGTFVWTSEPGIIYKGKRIKIDYAPENTALAGLLLELIKIGTIGQIGQLIIQRLSVHAHAIGSQFKLHRFAAAVNNTVYVPLPSRNLLRITASSIEQDLNGNNVDGVWVEAPADAPLDLPALPIDHGSIDEGFRHFEELIVSNHTCRDPAMAWFISIHGALMPFVRDFVLARPVVICTGPAQSGKTSAIQRISLLLGLGEVNGDFSGAALSDAGDTGLMTVDNLEGPDQVRGIVRYLIHVSTGGRRARSSPTGSLRTSSGRPIVMMTCIEGVFVRELILRAIIVPFRRNEKAFRRTENEQAIVRHCPAILNALIHVIQRFLQIREGAENDCPLRDFPDYWSTMVTLLRAYADVSGRERAWAESLAQQWRLKVVARQESEDALGFHIRRVILHGYLSSNRQTIIWKDKPAVLYVTTAHEILDALCRLNVKDIPATPAALARRILHCDFGGFCIVNDEDAPDIPELRRSTTVRRVGIIQDLDDMPSGIETSLPPAPAHLHRIDSESQSRPTYIEASDACFYFWRYSPSLEGTEPAAEDPANQLIWALKLPASMERASRHLPRSRAIAHAASAFSTLPDDLRSAAFVPMPSSETGADNADHPLVAILNHVRPTLDVRSILKVRNSLQPRAKGLRPADRAKNMYLAADAAERPRSIVIFDDVVTTASHFKAAQMLLRDHYGSVPIVGLFLACVTRSVARTRAAATAGG